MIKIRDLREDGKASNNNKVLNNTIVKLGYSYSVVLTDSQNNTLQGNTAGLNAEIIVVYDTFNSTKIHLKVSNIG